MITKLSVVIALSSLFVYMYGILITIVTHEKNTCKMTYMYEYPQFVKIHFRENEKFPRYNLYAYSEGHLTEAARNMKFNGAPILFVHGNSGSYKQARSFGSVALRKGIDNNWGQHLDYFAVDFNKEYSGVFGGVLDDQRLYLELCVKTVLNLYRNLTHPPTKVSIVAHSLGGKIAQSILMSERSAKSINTIIALSSPLDKPVLNIDVYFEAFYRKVNKFWDEHRILQNRISNTTNTCCNSTNFDLFAPSSQEVIPINTDASKKHLNDILLITIGGGSRDLLVHSGLTKSRFSDVHAMSSCIPGVWLTTDHLSAVWCLQQVLVINRFLYSIIQPQSKQKQPPHLRSYNFIEEKSLRLARAKYFFTQEIARPKVPHEVNLVPNPSDVGDWVEDSRRMFTEQFKYGLNRTRFQMIRLTKHPNHQMLNVEAINVDTDDWVFGCNARETDGIQRYCLKGASLTHFVKKLPSRRYNRRTLQLDLHRIKDNHTDWTHIVLVSLPTPAPLQFNIDLYNSEDRTLTVDMPNWYSYQKNMLLNSTTMGISSYQINVIGLDETYQTLELDIKPKCLREPYHIVARLCVPWTKGFERFYHFTESDKGPMYIWVPINRLRGYNTTENPVRVDLTLDPDCRYTISVKNSFGMTASRIVQQFSHWIPAHLAAILLLSFRHQLSLTPKKEVFKCGALHAALIRCSSFFIITASRLFVKAILWSKHLPDPDPIPYSILLSVIIHGSSLAILYFLTGALWCGIAMSGNFAYKLLYRLIQLPIPTISGIVVPVIQKFPITAGTMLISISMASCGGLALICAVIVYFILITKMYEDYLEEFVFKTAKLIAEKLFGRSAKSDSSNEDKREFNPFFSPPLFTKRSSEQNPKNTDSVIDSTSETTIASELGERRANDEPTNDAPANDKPIIDQNQDNSEMEHSAAGSSNVEEESTIKRRNKTSLDVKSDSNDYSKEKDDEKTANTNTDTNNTQVAKCNTYDLLCDQMKDEIAEAEKIMDEEANRVITKEEIEMDAELERLLEDMTKRQEKDDEERRKVELAARVEYDEVPDGMSVINFHITIFLFLCLLTILNLPSVISWARNYSHNETVLQNDPSFYPAIAALVSLSVIWQLSTPKNIYGYEPIASMCYMMAVICVLYCQDSFYRLNATLTAILIVVACQQLFMPNIKKRGDIKDNAPDIDLMDRVRKLKEDMVASEIEKDQAASNHPPMQDIREEH